MNERIRELAEQAKISATKNGKYNLVVVMPEFEQKFAELIVRECVWIVDNEGTSDEIFEHFGVK